jgi:hypothetical protein
MRDAWIHWQDQSVDRCDGECRSDAQLWLIWLLISSGLLAYSQIQLQFAPDPDQSAQTLWGAPEAAPPSAPDDHRG